MKRLLVLFVFFTLLIAVTTVQAQFAGLDTVVCEPQGGTPHPNTYWYDVTPGAAGRCDFHVRVYDPNPANYTAPSLPSITWQFAVHQVGSEWWASWWDPGCANAIFSKTTFQFTHLGPSTWGEWKTSISGTFNPYAQTADSTGAHGEPDGSGGRVHVPLLGIPTLSPLGFAVLALLIITAAIVFIRKRRIA